MAETTEQQPAVPPGEGWQWVLSYVRQDIQDLRMEIRDLRSQMTEMGRRFDRHFTITITTMLAIGGLLGTLIKL